MRTKFKKLTSVMLAVIMALSIFTVAPITASAETSGDFKYKLLADGTAEITEYSGSAKALEIPSEIYGYTVTSIGDFAFRDCESLRNITIPDSLKEIGVWSFGYCTSLTSVTIPDSVTSIGSHAFYGCESLRNITIPDSVTSIGSWAFYDTAWYYNKPDGVVYAGKVAYQYKGEMPENTSITLKEGTKGVAGSAFKDCYNLTNITIPDSVTNIGEYAFHYTAWYNNQPDGVVYAGKFAYEYIGYMPKNTSIILKEGTKGITGSAFRFCEDLASITIPDSVTSIGDGAFYNCTSLTSITIPDSVTSIGNGAFSDCTSLTSVTIGNGVKNISDSAFQDCESLTSITIPDSVTSIGSSAFDDCTSLSSITIPNSVTIIGSYAFYKCTKLESITIPDSVTSIGNFTFEDCTSLTSVTIPDSVTSIGNYAFSNCKNLTSVTIPDSVTSIGDFALGYIWDYKIHKRVKIDGFTIYGYPGTEAEKYAKEKGFTFVSLGDVLGDVNGNDKVDTDDATEIQKYVAKLIELNDEQKAVADTNGDGKIDTIDATQIQKYVAEIIPSLV